MTESSPTTPAAPTDSAESVRDDLVQRLLEHCSLMCVTGDEGPIADAVEQRYRDLGEQVQRVGDSVVVGGPDPSDREGGKRPLVVLVGHLDVVPPTDDDRDPHVTEVQGVGEAVVARGASDMKAGNVVAMRLFEDGALREASPYALALVLYAREEGPAEENELTDVLDAVPWITDAALGVVLEPTDGEVQLGCLGAIHAVLRVQGRQAHSARPWHGESAVDKSLDLLSDFAAWGPKDVEVDGITYRDVVNVTQAWTDNARNVLPGEFFLNVNFRFAPSRGFDSVEAELREFVGDRAEVIITDRSGWAAPRLSDPIVQQFVEAVGAEVAAKQAWTDVARFAAMDVPALNYGPGLTTQAHQRGEYVPVGALTDCWTRLRSFLAG